MKSIKKKTVCHNAASRFASVTISFSVLVVVVADILTYHTIWLQRRQKHTGLASDPFDFKLDIALKSTLTDSRPFLLALFSPIDDVCDVPCTQASVIMFLCLYAGLQSTLS